MKQHKLSIGFFAQIVTNGASRLAYLALLAHIATTAPENSTEQIEYLTVSLAISTILSLQAFPFSQSISESRVDEFIAACRYQFKIALAIALTVAPLAAILASTDSRISAFAGALVTTAVLFTINEIALAINTVKNRLSRSVIYYGVQLGFYSLYLAASSATNIPPEQIGLLISSFGIIGISAHLLTNSKTPHSGKDHFLSSVRHRSQVVAANIAGVLVQPVMVMILHYRAGDSQPTLGANFLILISIAGIIAFGFGNYFQYYGRLSLDNHIQNRKQKTGLIALNDVVKSLSACLILAIPASFIYTLLKHQDIAFPTPALIAAVGVYATSVIRSQWFSAICIRAGSAKPISTANLIFFFTLISIGWLLPEEINYSLLIASALKLMYQERKIGDLIRSNPAFTDNSRNPMDK